MVVITFAECEAGQLLLVGPGLHGQIRGSQVGLCRPAHRRPPGLFSFVGGHPDGPLQTIGSVYARQLNLSASAHSLQ